MEEETRPLNERDKKIIAELKIVEKLQKEEGCKLLDCGVVTNNVNLRIEIIDLKKKIREQEKVIKFMAEEILNNISYVICCENCPKYGKCDETDEDCVEAYIEYYTNKLKELDK